MLEVAYDISCPVLVDYKLAFKKECISLVTEFRTVKVYYNLNSINNLVGICYQKFELVSNTLMNAKHSKTNDYKKTSNTMEMNRVVLKNTKISNV